MATFFGHSLGKLLAMQKSHPVPFDLELVSAAGVALSIAVGVHLGCKIRRMFRTVYALTDRRLLIAVGPRRDKIRVVALSALAPVGFVRTPNSGLMLNFTVRGAVSPGQSQPPVWKFLESGQADTWSPRWLVRDPERVRQLIEDARERVSPPEQDRVDTLSNVR
jgi:hypothetical protein